MSHYNTSTQKIEKGDVVWVQYRKNPYWPALVHHVYPKKITYSFFPIRDDEKRRNRFTVPPKHAFAFLTTDTLSAPSPDLSAAFRAASAYLSARGKTRGSQIDGLQEAVPRRKNKGENGKKKRKNGKNQREEPAPKKRSTSSSTSTSPLSTSSEFSEDHRNTIEQQSKQLMELATQNLETLIDEIWESDEAEKCKNQAIGTKMTLKIRNNQFLTENDYETLFERVVTHVRSRRHPNQSISLLGAVNVTVTCLMPHLLVSSYATWKNVDFQTARDVFLQKNTRIFGLGPTMNIPVTGHLEELCRLACDESEKI